MTRTCPTCNGSRRVRRSVSRTWWQVLLLRPATVDELCGECVGTGVVRASPEDEAKERKAAEERARRQQPTERKAGEERTRPTSSTVRAPSNARSGIAHWLQELEADNYMRRIVAASELGKLGDPAALPALERMSWGTDNLWVLLDDEMRARARLAYPGGRIPTTDAEMLRPRLRGNNDRLKDAAKAAIAQIKERAGIATPEEAAMKVLNDAYLVRRDQDLEKKVAQALDSIHAGENGLKTLLDRLCDGVSIRGGHIQLANWGDMAWNELLKKREIVRCLQRAKDGRAAERLKDLLQAECSDGQWLEIVRPVLAEAIGVQLASALGASLADPSSHAAESNRNGPEGVVEQQQGGIHGDSGQVVLAPDGLHVRGDFVRPVRYPNQAITIDAGARVFGDVSGATVLICSGAAVTGNVIGREKVEIRKDGSLIGNMTTQRIVIHDGAYFRGSPEIVRPK